MELPPVSRDDRVLRRLRHLRREDHAAEELHHRRDRRADQPTADNGNGTKTVAFHAEDVHDFAWTADPNFKVLEEHSSTAAWER